MKKRFLVIVQDNGTGVVLHKSEGNTVIAGAASGDSASVFFYPGDEDEVAVLIDATENAFGGVLGEEVEE